MDSTGTCQTLEIKSNKLFSLNSVRNKSGRFVHICFINKTLEFLKPRLLFRQMIQQFEPTKIKLFDDLKFGWTYTHNLKSILYKPSETFLDFEHFNLECVCSKISRFQKFLMDIPPFGYHVLTTDMSICGNTKLTKLLEKGLNHIPPRNIQPSEAFLAHWDGWKKVAILLDFQPHLDHKAILDCKFSTMFSNKFPNYRPNPGSDNVLLQDQIDWLLNHFHFTGLDKSSQTITIICKHMLRLKAKERIHSPEFVPCLFDASIFYDQLNQFSFLPKSLNDALPYIMGTYKIHKNNFRWLTNAHECIFTPTTIFLTKCLKGLLLIIKEYTDTLHTNLNTFSKIDSNALWLIESQFDFLVNIPNEITSIDTFDITSCYEAIPHQGDFSLLWSLQKLCKIGSKLGYIGFGLNKIF